MLISNIKLAFRHLKNNKLYAIINVTGLAAGISCVLLAVMYWQDERSFDNFHQKKNQLYRITTTMVGKKGDKMHTSGGTGQVQGPAFKAGVPEVVDYVRVLGGGITGDILTDNKSLPLRLLFADENFFNIFSFPLLQGNSVTALNNINSVVITESVARKLFNSTDVIGKELRLDADPSAKRLGKPMLITGVAKDIPANSSIQFELLLPIKFMQLSFEDNSWINPYLSTFVSLHPNADRNAVIQKFNKLHAVYAKEEIAENIKLHGFNPGNSYGLQPITDIHLNPMGISMDSGVVNGSDPVFSYLFMGIAIFILLMATVNFINLSMAGSLKRVKEIGVRKLIGGSRMQIIVQFFCESAVLCIAAFILSVLLIALSLPVFNNLTGKQISFGHTFNTTMLFDLLAVLAVIILLTGLYPAWILSGHSTMDPQYHKQKPSYRTLSGKYLVVFQFSLAIFLLIATIVYYGQMNFISTKNLGYNSRGVIQTQIPGNREFIPIYQTLKRELVKETSIRTVSFGGGKSIYEVKLKDQSIDAVHKVIDENYLATLEIPLRAGRNISPAFPSDSSRAVLVNEAFVKAAGLKDPIGMQIKTAEYFDSTTKTIIGVIKDYHIGSLREPIQPMVMFMSNWYGGDILVKLAKSQQKPGLAALEKIYKKVIPQAVYQYHFLDDLNAKQYEQDQRWQQIISIATGLAITICCLGLFGLAHLTTSLRVKEIGIRKVLGATVPQVVVLLSASFLKLVIIAIFFAAPIAWLVMNKWLQHFAYRITMGVDIFIAAGLIAVFIALVAVGFQTIKAALSNPVKSLRTE